MFWGYFPLAGLAWGLIQSETSGLVPIAADALPTFRVYGADSQIPKATGTAVAWDAGNLTGVYKIAFTVSGAFERGLNYQVVASWTIQAGTAKQDVSCFSVY